MVRNLATGEELHRFRERDCCGWDYYSYCCELSEEFIIEFKDEVDWEAISACQYLSESFIKEYQDLICFDRLVRNENLSSYSKELQKLILFKLIKTKWVHSYVRLYFTDYMKELY